jgi:type IV pilus assembly protein PilE
LEALTVVTIITILAAIVYPSYVDQVRKSKRTVAKSALLDAANREEQYFFSNRTYANALNLLPQFSSATVFFDQDGSQTAVAGNAVYALSVAAVDDATACGTSPCFQLQAVPQNDQASDTVCGTFTLTSSNVKGAAGSNCW